MAIRSALQPSGLEELVVWLNKQSGDNIAAQLHEFSVAEGSGAIVLSCSDPQVNASALLACMSVALSFPVPSDLGGKLSEKLLARVRPSLVIVDDPQSSLAGEAVKAGWQVALLNSDTTLVIIAPARRLDLASYPKEMALMLQTSGTTGEPKLVGLTRANIAASCEGVADALELSKQDRTLTLMPLTHIHGIVATLGASMDVGAQVAVIAPRNPQAFWDSIEQVKPTWLTMVPTLLQSLLDTAPPTCPASLDDLRFIRTSSSSLPVSLRTRAEQYFRVPIIEAYGMTEASHQMASSRLNNTVSGWVGRPSKGVEISIRDVNGNNLTENETGEVCVRGPNVIDGYLWPQDANKTAFFKDWFRTGDLGFLNEHGNLKLNGRIKEQINRGGATISPLEVEEILLAHCDIAEAVVFPLAHDALGEEVAALCVMRADAVATEQSIKTDLASELDFERMPKTIYFASQLPKQESSGKVSRAAIAKSYANVDRPNAAPSSAPSDLSTAIATLAAEIIGVATIGHHDSFFDHGLTSLDAVRICVRLKADMGFTAVPTDLLVASTPKALASRIATNGNVEEKAAKGASPSVGPLLEAIAVRQKVSTDPQRNTATIIASLPSHIDTANVGDAWEKVCHAQPMLRARPHYSETGVEVEITPTTSKVGVIETHLTAQMLKDTPGLLDSMSGLESNGNACAQIIAFRNGERWLVIRVNQFLADGFAHHLLVRHMNAALSNGAVPTSSSHLELCKGLADATDDQPQDCLAPLDAGQEPEFKKHVIALPERTWKQLNSSAVELRTTPFAIGLAAFSHVLERATGEPFPIWFATQKRQNQTHFETIANATKPRFLRMASANQSLADLSQTLTGELFSDPSTTEAVPHRNSTPCWFEIADEGHNIARILGADSGPLEILNIHSVDPGQPGLELSIVPSFDSTTDAKITLTYDVNVLSLRQAESLCSGFLLLLEQALATPEKALNLMKVVSETIVLPQWPVTHDTPFQDVYSDFEKVCRDQPDAIALRSQDHELSFSRLETIVCDLGKAITDRAGAGPLRISAIASTGNHAVESQIAVIAALLLAQRDGHVFMPLAAQMPKDQCIDDITQMGIDIVIGLRDDERLEPLLNETAGFHVDFPSTCLGFLEPDAPIILPQMAQIIYSSSGTTGVRKKICVNSDRFICYLNGLVGADLMKAAPGLAGPNVSFDVWGFNVLFPLLSGLPVILLKEQRRTSDVLLAAANLGARNISLTPTVAAAALNDDPECLQHFHSVYFIGETLSDRLQNTLMELAPTTSFLNAYGTTETSISATLNVLGADNGETVLLGKAIPGFQVFLLDRIFSKPQMDGWSGEVAIVQPSTISPYVSSAATAQSLAQITDGVTAQRTGDLGQILQDGGLRLAGRTDRQVKINGTRLELDVIESIVEATGLFRTSAVVFDSEKSRLSLFVAPPSNDDAIEKVRHALLSRLPRSVRNLDIIQLDDIPVGPTGKKRRNELPTKLSEQVVGKPNAARLNLVEGTIEHELFQIWTRILSRVEASDLRFESDFFNCGGTSLDLLRLVGMVKTDLKIEIPEENFFANSTFYAQVSLLKEASNKALPSGPNQNLQHIATGAGHDVEIELLVLPSLWGQNWIAGMLAGLNLKKVKVISLRPTEESGNLIRNNKWHALVTQAADYVTSRPATREVVLTGFSFGGWLAWATDLELQSRGHGPTRIINFDAAFSHGKADRPTLTKFVDLRKSNVKAHIAPEMLLFHRRENQFVHDLKNYGSIWHSSGAAKATCIDVPTIDHLDFSRVINTSAQKERIEEFLFGGQLQTEYSSLTSNQPSEILFGILEKKHPPSHDMVVRLMYQFENEQLTSAVAMALLCCAISTGDINIMEKMIRRLEDRSEQSQLNGTKAADSAAKAIFILKLALANIQQSSPLPSDIVAEANGYLTASFLTQWSGWASGITAPSPLWHSQNRLPILSQRWIRKSFR